MGAGLLIWHSITRYVMRTRDCTWMWYAGRHALDIWTISLCRTHYYSNDVMWRSQSSFTGEQTAQRPRRNFVSRQVIGQLRWWHAWPDPTGRSQHVSGSGQVVTDRWSLGCVPSGHGQHSWPWRWPPRRRCLRIHVCRCADSAASVSDSISTASHTTSSYNGKPTPIDTESLSSRTYQHPQ